PPFGRRRRALICGTMPQFRAADRIAPECDWPSSSWSGELDGRKPPNGLCPNFLLKSNRERHRNQMPADKADGTDRPNDRYGCSRNPGERPRGLTVPGLRTDPQMDTQ